MVADADKGDSTIITVLTLERHSKGIWITNLLVELERILCPSYELEVVSLESLDLTRFGTYSIPSSWRAIVNRVSDAANPVQSKACQAVLTSAAIWGLPVFNGPHCYSIGCNKFLHHQIFTRAGLRTPRSVLVRFSNNVEGEKDSEKKTTDIVEKLLSASKQLEEHGCQWPLLIKPNSAGFGSGIAFFSSQEKLEQYARQIVIDDSFGPSNDGLALLQEYIQPNHDFIYRVWFLNGRVQCATKRAVGSKATENAMLHDFTSGCAGSASSCQLSNHLDTTKGVEKQKFATGCLSGSSCALKATSRNSDEVHNQEADSSTKTNFYAWKVPQNVQNEIVDLLKYVGSDCHAGSVEFLYDSSGERVYFDLNMLSTLPTTHDGSVENSGVWSDNYNPWLELAEYIKEFILDHNFGP